MARALSRTVLSFGLIFKAVAARSVRVVRLVLRLTAAALAAATRGGIGLAHPRRVPNAVAFATWCWTRSLRNRATVTKSSKSSKSAVVGRTVRVRA